MSHTRDLAELSRLATVEFSGDDALERALEIVKRRLRAGRVSLVYGWADGFRHFSTSKDLDFTATALWLVNRDLTTRNAPCAFDRVGARVVDFRAAASTQPAQHLAMLVPMPHSVSEMIVATGDWVEGLSASEVAFITAAGPALSMLMQRGLRLIEADRSQNQLTGLMAITRVIAESEDLEQVLVSLAKAISNVTNVGYITIDIVDREQGSVLRCVNYAVPDDAASLDRWSKAANRRDPFRDRAMASRVPELFPDAQNDQRLTEAARAFFSRVLIRSTALFPLITKDGPLGVLSIGSSRPLAFDRDEVELFEGLALQIATAVAGIQMYHELAEKSQLLERALDVEREHGRRDSLTGVLNHAGIAATLQAEISRTEPNCVAVAMMDVDGMKVVNDTFGHLSGDAVLIAVAETLAEAGGIVGRYGGDEFLVVLSDMDRASAERYVQDVLDRLEERTVTDPYTGASIRIELSAGLSVFPQEASSLIDLIKIADGAMYSAKAIRAAAHADRRYDERTAKMIGELIPLLTSPGELSEKLDLVAQRLCADAAYDGVICRLFQNGQALRVAAGTFRSAPVWRGFEDSSMAAVLRETQRPMMFNNAPSDERLGEGGREVVRGAGLNSGIIAPMIWQNDLLGVVVAGRKQINAFSPRDAQFLAAVANQVTAIVRMSTIVDELQIASTRLAGAQAETVMMLAAAAEAHDHTTGLHLESIRGISEALACELGYTSTEIVELGLAATLHDIGKISVPDVILSSPMRFDTDDWESAMLWETMKQHSVWGAEFLSGRGGFELAARVARWHHERWDGQGYPDGIADREIPEEVAIVTVADALDAMISDRPYRSGRPLDVAVAEIVACSGKQFSPRVVDALLRLHARGGLPRQARHEVEQAAA